MAKRRVEPETRSVELLEQLVMLQLHALGTTQNKIARLLGKQTALVNGYLKGLPRPRRQG